MKTPIKKIGINVLALNIFGYIGLMSYTWPQGFIPLISLDSIPILLLGFTLIIFAIYFFASLLFLPIFIYKHNSFFISTVFLLDNDITHSSLARLSRMSYIKLFIRQYRNIGIIGVYHPFVLFVLVVAISSSFWYGIITSLAIDLFSIMIFIFSIIMLKFSHASFGKIFTSEKSDEVRSSIIILSLIIIFAPSFLLWLSVNKNPPYSNPIFQQALSAVRLGGGLYSEINMLDEKNMSGMKGELLFYDGNRAWIHHCNKKKYPNVLLVNINNITVIPEKKCE